MKKDIHVFYDFQNKLSTVYSFDEAVEEAYKLLNYFFPNKIDFFSVLGSNESKQGNMVVFSEKDENFFKVSEKEFLSLMFNDYDKPPIRRIRSIKTKKISGIFDFDKITFLNIENSSGWAFTIFLDIREESKEEVKIFLSILSELMREKIFSCLDINEREIRENLGVINEVRDMLYSIVNLNDMLSILGDLIIKYSKPDFGLVMLFDKDDLIIKNSWNNSLLSGISHDEIFNRDFPYVIESVSTEEGRLLIDILKTERSKHVFNSLYDSGKLIEILKMTVFFPLMSRGECLGYFGVFWRDALLAKKTLATMEIIVSLASSSIQNNRLYDQIIKEQLDQKDLQIAHNIQQRLQARMIPKLRNFEIEAVSVPARAIGGDYYDYFDVGENILGIVLTDIVGKGVPAALIMAFFKGIMQSSVYETKSPKNIFEIINRNLNKNKSVKNYIPTVYSVLDDESKSVIYSNAGHEFPLFYKSESNQFLTLEEGGMPLGAFSEVDYEESRLIFEKGDILCLFTDGVTEARNPNAIVFGEERLKNIITDNKSMSAKEILNKIFEQVFLFSGDNMRHDDFTVIVIKCSK